MPELNVLVVFYSRYGDTEKLALAAGVGAIQTKANIRLRRLADLADASTIAGDARWKENLDRMNMDYVVPRPADPEWADLVVLAAPADAPREIEQYCRSLKSVAGKMAAPLVPASGADCYRRICAAASAAGFVLAPSDPADGRDVGGARAYGRRASDAAREMKEP
jgi:hypothetical protein